MPTPSGPKDIVDAVNSLAKDVQKLKQQTTTSESLAPTGSIGTDPSVTTITVGGVTLNTTSSPPTSLVLTTGAFYTNIFVDSSWTAPANGSAAEYRVQIAVKVAVTYTLVEEVRTGGTSVRFNALLPNQIYGVRVIGVNRIGVPSTALPASGWTDIATGVDATVPVTLTGLSVGQGLRSVTAAWDESPDVDVKNGNGQYEVQIATNAGFTTGVRNEFTSATVISFTDLIPSQTYWARVRAIDSSLNVGSYTAGVSTATLDATSSDGSPPSSSPTPTVRGGPGFIYAEWLAAGGTTDPITYEVHVSTTTGFTPSASTLTEQTSGTFAFIKSIGSAAGPLFYATNYYVKLIAKDRDGAAAAGGQGFSQMAQNQTDDIAIDAITAGQILDASVITAKIAAAAITTTKIANDAVTAVQIATAAITSAKIADNAVTAVQIATAAITSAKIANDAVIAATIAANAVTAAKIADANITTAKIANDAITAAQIATGAVGSTEIAAGAIVAGKITAGTIVSGDIAAGTITAGNIAANTITSGNIAAGAITATQIATGAITAVKIAAGTITANEIAANTITSTQILAGTILASDIAAGTITANEIAANTITTTQILAGTILASDIAAGTITANELAANSVTATQIAAGAITAAKIAAQAITTEKLSVGSLGASTVPNGSFEDVDGSNFPMLWTPRVIYNAGSNSYGTVFSPTYSGSRSGFISGTSNTAEIDLWSAATAVEPGEIWTLSFFARASVAISSGFFARVVYQTIPGGTAFTSYADLIFDSALSTTFVQFSAQMSVPAGFGWARVQLLMFRPNVGATIYFDNVQLRRVTIGTEIKDGSIITQKIAVGAITAGSAIIANAAILTANINDLAVTNAKIANLSVDSLKIADLAVTNAKIGNLAVDSAKIADLAVTNAKIANATIDSAKIVSLAANKITAGTITSQDITLGSGGQLKTASLAPGMLINANGINFYNSSGINTISFSAATGGGSFTGNVNSSTITGGTIVGASVSSAATGRRITITSTPNNTIQFYSGAAEEVGAGAFSITALTLTGHGSYGRVLIASPVMSGGTSANFFMDSSTGDNFGKSQAQINANDITLSAGTHDDAVQIFGPLWCSAKISIGGSPNNRIEMSGDTGTAIIMGGPTGGGIRPTASNSSDVQERVGDGVNYGRTLSWNGVSWRDHAALAHSNQSDPMWKDVRRTVKKSSSIDLMRSIGRPFLFSWKRDMVGDALAGKEWVGIDATSLPPTLTTETELPIPVDENGKRIRGAAAKKSLGVNTAAMDAFLLGICHDLADQIEELTRRVESLGA